LFYYLFSTFWQLPSGQGTGPAQCQQELFCAHFWLRESHHQLCRFFLFVFKCYAVIWKKNPAQLVAGLVGPDHETCWFHLKPAQVPPNRGDIYWPPPPNPLHWMEGWCFAGSCTSERQQSRATVCLFQLKPAHHAQAGLTWHKSGSQLSHPFCAGSFQTKGFVQDSTETCTSCL